MAKSKVKAAALADLTSDSDFESCEGNGGSGDDYDTVTESDGESDSDSDSESESDLEEAGSQSRSRARKRRKASARGRRRRAGAGPPAFAPAGRFVDSDGVDMRHSLLHCVEWGRVVLDEAHKIKARTSSTAKSAINLSARRRWCLTGTPLQNRVGELYALVRFLQLDPFAFYGCTCKGGDWRESGARARSYT